MNNVEYNFLKKEYDLYKESKEDNQNIQLMIEELENDPKVIEYKRLIARSNYYTQNYGSTLNSTEEFMDSLLNKFIINNEANIYVEVNNNHNGKISEKLYGQNCKQFRMLERAKDTIGSEKLVLDEELEEFEKNNIVIYPPNIVDKDDFFKDLQCKYFEIAFEEGKDKAYKYILQNKNN